MQLWNTHKTHEASCICVQTMGRGSMERVIFFSRSFTRPTHLGHAIEQLLAWGKRIWDRSGTCAWVRHRLLDFKVVLFVLPFVLRDLVRHQRNQGSDQQPMQALVGIMRPDVTHQAPMRRPALTPQTAPQRRMLAPGLPHAPARPPATAAACARFDQPLRGLSHCRSAWKIFSGSHVRPWHPRLQSLLRITHRTRRTHLDR